MTVTAASVPYIWTNHTCSSGTTVSQATSSASTIYRLSLSESEMARPAPYSTGSNSQPRNLCPDIGYISIGPTTSVFQISFFLSQPLLGSAQLFALLHEAHRKHFHNPARTGPGIVEQFKMPPQSTVLWKYFMSRYTPYIYSSWPPRIRDSSALRYHCVAFFHAANIVHHIYVLL